MSRHGSRRRRPRHCPRFRPTANFGAGSRELLELFEVDMDGARFRAGFVQAARALAAYLAHVAVAITPLFRRDDIVEICSQIVSRIDAVVPPLAEGFVGGTDAFRRRDRRCVAWLVAGLSRADQSADDCLSAILRDALPETSSI